MKTLHQRCQLKKESAQRSFVRVSMKSTHSGGSGMVVTSFNILRQFLDFYLLYIY